jgi:hypothetical protein
MRSAKSRNARQKGRKREEKKVRDREEKDEPIDRKLKRETRNFLEDNIDEAMRDNPKVKDIDEMFSTLALLAQKYLFYGK